MVIFSHAVAHARVNREQYFMRIGVGEACLLMVMVSAAARGRRRGVSLKSIVVTELLILGFYCVGRLILMMYFRP
jgi:hypothetical protein